MSSFIMRGVCGCFTSFIIALVWGPFCIRFLNAHGYVDGDKSPSLEVRKEHADKVGTPVMGGLIFIVAFILSVLIWCDWSNLFVWGAILSSFGFALIGGIDDVVKSRMVRNGLSVRVKFFLLILVAVAVVCFLCWYLGESLWKLCIPIIGVHWYIGAIGFVVLGIFVLLGCSNAVNLTDGMDGLAIGCSIICAIVFGIFSCIVGKENWATLYSLLYVPGAIELFVCCMILVGASFGFLWFNGFPATVFMGDCGSLMLGGFLGYVAIALRMELWLVVIGGIFVMEAVSVILQVSSYRLRNKKRIFLCAPIHHHFRRLGCPETRIINRFWITSFFLGLLALASVFCIPKI
ncbi:MAG: phospho-N-acetylmuramoyl-pentapeptide-transferase [Planctomycetes bacterium]|nr:phospho-N-acetylmuramoyl-pentapeptide-transferase [Planctomycetota bacterium]HPY75505.1 phospho-N-acetylmuramoyl-pentapeptide-transferase [Planctomycetota bacterium]HQB00346.1 phospho-N-acetylmuramoyl-pentapeptide-transferase [Planctomycetota bacterium]HRU52304.1 phospho-N-acetylmuramoyl-pentapeptide-transferase [Planctomycetota bacterium]